MQLQEEKGILLSLKTSPMARTPKWFARIAKFNGWTETRVLRLTAMAKVLNKVYKDRWDVYLTKEYRSIEINFIIHFPTVTITNSANQSHTMKDVFIMLEMGKVGQTFVDNIRLFRTTFAPIEAMKDYVHSHVNSWRIRGFTVEAQTFCLGNNEVSDMLKILKTEYNNDLFEFFLLSIENMVAWESLEGVPYISIDRLYNNHTNHYISLYDLEKISNPIIDHIDEKKIDLYYHLDRYKIVDNSNYKEAVKEAVIKAEMGEKALYNYNPSVERKKKFICDFGVVCRNRKHQLRILPQQQVKIKPIVKELVLINIKKRIENDLYKRKIAENILHQYGQSYR